MVLGRIAEAFGHEVVYESGGYFPKPSSSFLLQNSYLLPCMHFGPLGIYPRQLRAVENNCSKRRRKPRCKLKAPLKHLESRLTTETHHLDIGYEGSPKPQALNPSYWLRGSFFYTVVGPYSLL